MVKYISKALKKTRFLFISWVLFSTILPSLLARSVPGKLSGSYYTDSTSLYALNGPQVVESGLVNTHIVLAIAHPDDEVMFFAPSILELAKPDYGNTVSLVCFSSGNAEGIGATRTQEVVRSGQVLGISDVKVIDSPDFEDSMSLTWDADRISRQLEAYVAPLNADRVAILTFDGKGISGHPNHVSMYHGSVQFAKSRGNVSVWALRTWPLVVKYSGFIVSAFSTFNRMLENSGLKQHINELRQRAHETLPLDRLRGFEKHATIATEWVAERVGQDTFDEIRGTIAGDGSLTILADAHSVLLAVGDMVFCHYSQIVWFRWLWLLVSRYTNSNELIPVV